MKGILLSISVLLMGGGSGTYAFAADRGPESPSARSFFPSRVESTRLDAGGSSVISFAGNSRSDAAKPDNKSVSPPLKAEAGASDLQFVGILMESGATTVSTLALGETFDTEIRNYIQQPLEANAGLFVDGSYYAILEFGMADLYFIYQYNSSIGWGMTSQVRTKEMHPTALAYDTASGVTYGCFGNASGISATTFSLATLDLNTGDKTDVATLPQKFLSMTCDNAGILYGLGADGSLHIIDKATAETKEVGTVGLMVSDKSSISFDHAGKTLYCFADNAVYTIDTADGTADKVMDFTGRAMQWTGMCAMPEAEAVTPSWIDNFTIDFPNGTLSGHVRMKMPSMSTSNTPLDGTLTWHLLVDDVETTGEAAPGADVAVPLTLEAGFHNFVAYADFDGTPGLEGSQRMYIGHDMPMTPENVSVTENGSSAVISWSPVTKSVNGGYIDLDALRYTVTRNPGAVVVADGLDATSFTDATISSMDYYSYNIVASDGVGSSKPATSETLLLGKGLGVRPPFSHSFDNNGFGLFTFNDANQDGASWMYSEGYVWFMINPEQDSDDWLVSPPVSLEKGKHYKLLVNMIGSANMETHRVDLCYGKGNTPEELKDRIRASVFMVRTTFDEWIVPEEDGEYFFGMHVLTQKVNGAISIVDFSIGEGYDGEAPGTAVDLAVKAAPLGAMQSTVSFKCPDIDFAGNTLKSIGRVVVTNTTTGTVVEEFLSPKSGAELSVIDEKPAQGNNTYTVVCKNESGEGMPVEATCWVGVDLPGAPKNVCWVQDGDIARLTWEAPTEGQHGGYMDSSGLKYNVSVGNSLEPICDAVTGFSAEFQPVLENPQDALQFNVWAVNESGTGAIGRSNQSAFGTPYPTPFYESFEGAGLHSTPWLLKAVEGYNAINVVTYVEGLYDQNGMPVTSYDNDGGMAVYNAFDRGVTRLEMPITDISTLKKPVMNMWCMFIDDKTSVTIKGNNNSGTEWEDIATFTKPEDIKGWHLVTISLDKFKGEKHLQLGIECASSTNGFYVMFDRISIEEGFDIDLMMSDVTFPAKLYAGKDFTTSVTVTNAGLKDSPVCEVQVFIDGKFVSSVPVASLPPCGVANVDVDAFLSSNATSALVQAQILCLADENPNNNAYRSNIHVVRSALPAPVALANVSESNSVVKLSWASPECRYNAPLTDSFEDLEAGSVGGIDVKLDASGNVVVTKNEGMLGAYKLVDNDKLTTTTTLPMLNTPNSQNGMVCQVVDVEEFNLRGTSTIWEAHSGNKLLAFWQCKRYNPETGEDTDDDPNDDWFILPKLAENDKFISLWAKSLTNKYGLESFEIMVSTESDDIADFERFAYATEVPAGYATSPEHGYTYYEFDLPEETQYAAIHYNAAGTLALLIDDITYTPEGNMVDIELLGYNVYRDDQRLNDKPLATPEFSDAPVSDGTYTYNVTALFAEGESPYSNTVTVSGYSGVDNVGADAGQGCVIRVEGRYIVIATATMTNVCIYSPDGRMLRSAEADGEVRIGMEPGIYIVKSGDVSRSVIVK